MMNIIIYILLGAFTLGCTSPKVNIESNKQQENCLTAKNFNSIVSYIEDNGKPIKLSERLMSDKESLSLEVSIGMRSIQLENYQDHKRIIIIDNNEDHKIPPYFVSIENKELQISAYYSRFDTEEDRKKRADHWCNIVSEFAIKQ